MYLEERGAREEREVQALKFIKNERFSILSRGQWPRRTRGPSSKLVEMYLGKKKNKVREKNRGSSSQVYKEREVQYTVERTVTKKYERSFKVNGQ